MKLYMKQHVFTWGDRFSVYDEAGSEVYYVEGEVFTFGKKLHLYDLNGAELAYVEQELFTFLPKYHIYQNGMKIAEVVKEFALFAQEYRVCGLEWCVSGDWLAHEYEITDARDNMVVSVSKQWLTWGDTYEIQIADETDASAALAVVLVIDACLAQNNN